MIEQEQDVTASIKVGVAIGWEEEFRLAQLALKQWESDNDIPAIYAAIRDGQMVLNRFEVAQTMPAISELCSMRDATMAKLEPYRTLLQFNREIYEAEKPQSMLTRHAAGVHSSICCMVKYLENEIAELNRKIQYKETHSPEYHAEFTAEYTALSHRLEVLSASKPKLPFPDPNSH